MRLGRPLAAASVMTAVIGATLTASPALADGSIKFADDQPHTVTTTDTAFAVSGTGCTGQDATVGIALYAPDGTMSTIVTAKPGEDGSWSTTLNIPELVKSTGVEAKTDGSADGWTIDAGCLAYGQPQGGQAQHGIVFDDTDVEGTYRVATDENSAQTFTIDATGFSPNEQVTVTLVGKDDRSITYLVGTLAADANGAVQGSLPTPSGVADGQYLLTLEGARYGEGGTGHRVIVVENGVFRLADDPSGDNGFSGNGDSTTAPAAPGNNGSNVSVPASTGATQAASTSNKPLARTGSNGLLFGGIAAALVAIGGGALFLRRRKA
ncbi:peptidase [Actinomyces viscosus]|uniref:Gram-positive cocci surface proteins LPxTG domain-containing protein n=1 Tax=Actinomyces viscosus TaxID=1656 RepID=A0A3S4VJJ6_ACTVI|nr:LPXTG cell wall anchor domain-containing protein [Actinomyces viscosus]TFH53215.1 peptidase [Actinomyces viscosus]VEI15633.1 Uncharacterised protein [Actinomyces viscosus]